MTTKQSRRVPEEVAATREEIDVAIEALTPSDWAKIKRIADYQLLRLGPKVDSRTGEDLMQAASHALLEGTRRWNKDKIGFLQFLVGAMRSISSNWARSYKVEEIPVLEADLLRENEEGEIFSPLENTPGNNPAPVKRLIDEQTLELIDDLFKDDEKVQMILTAWQEGYGASGVRELWSLSQKEYNTIVRRIRRQLHSAGITPDCDKGGANVQKKN